jgi:hypothetical protein
VGRLGVGRLGANLFCPSEPSFNEEADFQSRPGQPDGSGKASNRAVRYLPAEVDKVVESYAEAETVASAFAAQQGYPWYRVAMVSK